MAIQPVQLNKNCEPAFKQEVKPYREAEGVITTEQNVKPLPPKGHLVDDDFASSTKFFFKDIEYDLKSFKDGYNGVANDHQLGRLNRVGLILGGTGIATYLASRTTNPKARLMEYIGLATFLTSMALYPKIAINAPAKALHGYDIDKEYIDDQGRKKSVQQDSNYVPYDMYMSGNKGEDLDAIGDKIGIPRDIKNRHDVIREQMRKVATQNNTLWMLTAGFATPLMTALLCNVLENYVVAPGMEKSRNAKFNAMIDSTLNKTIEMGEDISKLENGLSKHTAKVLSKYKGGVVPNDVLESLLAELTKDVDSNLAKGIRTDIKSMLAASENVAVSSDSIDVMLENAYKNIRGRNVDKVRKEILPTKLEVERIITDLKSEYDLGKEITLNKEEFAQVQEQISQLIDEKIAASADIPKDFAIDRKSDFIQGLKWKKATVLEEENINKAVDFAKILGDFKDKQAALDKCKNFKFEYAPETILARYYNKFQDALIKELGISHKDYAKLRDDSEFAKKLLDEKISELCKDEAKYQKTFEKLGGIMADMEKALHNAGSDDTQILKLINAIENNYNNTAIRLDSASVGKETADILVKQDVASLRNEITTSKELREFLDGIIECDSNEMIEVAKGKGSSKNLEISRLVSRYQGQMNSFFRTLHTLDLYKRAAKPEDMLQYTSLKDKEYIETLLRLGKDSLLGAKSSDYVMKFNTINNPMGYKDMVHSVWTIEEQTSSAPTKHKGLVSESAKKSLDGKEKIKNANILERFQFYISRSKNILTNNYQDFTKPYHNFWSDILGAYTKSEKTNEAMFNLVGQTPVDMIQKGAARKRGDRKWMAIIGAMTAGIFGITILSQFAFGKISNKHNLQKQVTNDTDK